MKKYAKKCLVILLAILSLVCVFIGEPVLKVIGAVVLVEILIWSPGKKHIKKERLEDPVSDFVEIPVKNKTTPLKDKKKNTLLYIAILGLILALLFLLMAISSESDLDKLKSFTNPKINHSRVIEDAQIDYVNEIRLRHGVAPLEYDDGLLKSASLKTQDMIRRNYWDHKNPENDEFYKMINESRPGLKLAGENIAQCFESHKAMYISYERSPGHLENIINPKFTRFGGSTMWNEQKQCFTNTNHFGG